MKQKVDIQGNSVKVDDEITEYYSREYACYAGWCLAWYLKSDLYVDGWYVDKLDFYGDGDPEFPPICHHL